MSKKEFTEYQTKTHAIKISVKPKYLAARVIEEKFSDFKGNNSKLRYDINNALFGKSYTKAVELNLMPTINKLYKQTLKNDSKVKRK